MDSWKEELFLQVREDHERDGLSIRALAHKYRVGRDLVRQALSDPQPPPRKTPVRRAPVLGPYHAVIDQWLRQDVTAPPKQRHTATRIADRLEREYGARMSYSNIADYVARRRPQILTELGARPGALPGFVERAHAPGADAEVDFGELWVVLGGEMTRCFLFAMRLCYSGRAVHKVYSTMSLESFLDGHAYALRVLGGVPTGVVRYDNLKVAVQKVILRSRAREETERWSAFHAHYGFTPWYCLPGLGGAHEKGGAWRGRSGSSAATI
jgi:transposase